MRRDPHDQWADENVVDLGLAHDDGDETEAAEDGWDSPRDEALAVYEFGTTGWEIRRSEPLDGYLQREVPEPVVEAAGAPAPGAEVPLPGFTEDDGWDEASHPDPFAGRLVAQDEGAHDTLLPEEVAWVAADDTGGYSAEEAAMHVVSDQEV